MSIKFAKVTRKDPILSRVLQFVMTGWPDKQNEPKTTHYFTKRHEITVEDGCLLWGIRVIIPKQLRERALHELHTGHPGIVRMKSLARLRGTQRLFSVKYLFGEAKIAYNFL